MLRPAVSPGRLLERNGDVAPRGMTVHDRTRLTGRLRHFIQITGSPLSPLEPGNCGLFRGRFVTGHPSASLIVPGFVG